jgi:AbiU2
MAFFAPLATLSKSVTRCALASRALQKVYRRWGAILVKPTLKQTLDALKRQVLNGKSYMKIASGLAQADPEILQTAPTFFYMTIDGAVELAQIGAARLYDRASRAVTIVAMLRHAASQADTFRYGDRPRVETAIRTGVRRVIAIQPIVDVIRRRRDKWLAHLDQETVQDPAALSAKARLTIPDLERVFTETEEIVLEFSSLYEGVVGELHYLGGEDFKTALDWIRRAKCAFIERYEMENGAGSWNGPRPKDCSRKPYELI